MKLPTYIELDKLSTEDLRALNHLVVGILRDRAAMRQVQAGRDFYIGQIAAFEHRGREVLFRIDRINTKTLSGPQVDELGNLTGRKARAAPTLCRPIQLSVPALEEEEPAPPASAPVRRRMRLRG
jgi:hypothetical protein